MNLSLLYLRFFEIKGVLRLLVGFKIIKWRCLILFAGLFKSYIFSLIFIILIEIDVIKAPRLIINFLLLNLFGCVQKVYINLLLVLLLNFIVILTNKVEIVIFLDIISSSLLIKTKSICNFFILDSILFLISTEIIKPKLIKLVSLSLCLLIFLKKVYHFKLLFKLKLKKKN